MVIGELRVVQVLKGGVRNGRICEGSMASLDGGKSVRVNRMTTL